MYHYVMTIQSVWNGEAKGLVTVEGLTATSRRSQAYAEAVEQAKGAWRRSYPQTSLGQVAVVFFAFEKEEA